MREMDELPGDQFNPAKRKERKLLMHEICDLEQRLALISAIVETERRRNTEARLEARLLEALLTSRLVLKHLIKSSGSRAAADERDRAAKQGGVAGTGGNAAFPGAMLAFPSVPSAAPVVTAGLNACADAGLSGAAPPAEFPLLSLLERLQAAMDGLIDELYAAEQRVAGTSPCPPLAYRVRSSTLLDNIMAAQQQPFANARELYVWWLQRMAEASSALLDAGGPTRVGWGGGDGRRCNGNGDGGTPAVEMRLVEVLHSTALRVGCYIFHPWSFELVTLNLERWQPGKAGEDMWAAWLEAMGLSEQQEFLLLRLRDLYENHIATIESEHRRLLEHLSQTGLDLAEQSDIVDALAAVNRYFPICSVSIFLAVCGAVLTPWQVLRLYTVASPQWVPDQTALLDAVAHRAAQRQQQE